MNEKVGYKSKGFGERLLIDALRKLLTASEY